NDAERSPGVRGCPPESDIPHFAPGTVNTRTDRVPWRLHMTRARRAAMVAMLLFGSMTAWAMLSAPRVKAEPTDCMGPPATIVGDKDANPGDGVIRGTDGNDIIIGIEGPDKIEGEGGDDRICGQGGDDS